MVKIKLMKLTLRNFKGIKDLVINFGDITNIKGNNGTGKTTVADGALWLLFDKDSHDRTAFEIKTLDKNGEVIHGLDHEVSGVFNVNGKNITLTKIYKEKWTKKRGEAESTLTGHETLYYIDDVPVKQIEYKQKVNSLIDENIFKLITNPLFFSTNMKWQDRREVLMTIIGDIPTDRVIGYNRSLAPLAELLEDKTADMLKKSIAARKTKLNKDIALIPARIDEVNKSIKEYDFEALETEVKEIQYEIKQIDDQLQDSSKVNKVLMDERNKLYELKDQLNKLEFGLRLKAKTPLNGLLIQLNEINKEISTSEIRINRYKISIQGLDKQIDEINKKLPELRNIYTEVNHTTLNIPENSFICPTCHRELEVDTIEEKKQEMIENFNQKKSKELTEINNQGKSLKADLERLETDRNISKTGLEAEESVRNVLLTAQTKAQSEYDNFTVEINVEENPEYQALKKQISEQEEKVNQPATVSQNTQALKDKKTELSKKLDEVKKQLMAKDLNISFRARINELMDEEKSLGEQIAELERQEYLCEEFIKTKVELLESSINSKFKYVSFRLFSLQINGGLVETCEALINGVPFSNANTAGQINAGIDIINALCDHYGVSAPIFIDNREAVNEIIDCDSQIINLVVTTDNILKIESEVI